MKKVELLAPAGNLEKLKIAILYGADAVFIGGKTFSLRAKANNFEKEDLKEYFAEFRKYEPYCRFQGCMHLSEPDCGVKEALAEGKISSIRYESYKELYEELKQKRRY